MTWKDSFLLNLMKRANRSKCACKVCWTLRQKYLEISKDNIVELRARVKHFEKMGRFVGKAKTLDAQKGDSQTKAREKAGK